MQTFFYLNNKTTLSISMSISQYLQFYFVFSTLWKSIIIYTKTLKILKIKINTKLRKQQKKYNIAKANNGLRINNTKRRIDSVCSLKVGFKDTSGRQNLLFTIRIPTQKSRIKLNIQLCFFRSQKRRNG